jgi:hypothetical protein
MREFEQEEPGRISGGGLPVAETIVADPAAGS